MAFNRDFYRQQTGFSTRLGVFSKVVITVTGPDAALHRLGLNVGASPADITAAYRRLAWLTHPDRCPEEGAAERFATLSAAYREAISAPVEPVTTAVRRAAPRRAAASWPHPLVAGPVRFTPWPEGPTQARGR